jgi:hypothetical protein
LEVATVTFTFEGELLLKVGLGVGGKVELIVLVLSGFKLW